MAFHWPSIDPPWPFTTFPGLPLAFHGLPLALHGVPLAFLIVQTWREYSERKTKMKKLVLWSREQSHEMKRLLLFESYFYEVDTESDGVLTMDELRTFLS